VPDRIGWCWCSAARRRRGSRSPPIRALGSAGVGGAERPASRPRAGAPCVISAPDLRAPSRRAGYLTSRVRPVSGGPGAVSGLRTVCPRSGQAIR
jgi:hypothetical protein